MPRFQRMPGNPLNSDAGGAQRAIFATTHWSVVLKAGDAPGDDSSRALDTLCRAYWYPLYAYIRRLGHAPHDAQDLTQSYFAYLLEKGLLSKADPEAGRFRSFLLGSLKNFMANEWRKQSAQKRNAGRTVSFDATDAEERYAIEPVDQRNPQALFEQAWAVTVLDHAMSLLEAEYATAGKRELLNRLLPSLQGDRLDQTYAETGAALGMSEGAIKVAVHRLRQRYRELLRSAVASTVADPLEVDRELQHLMSVLS